MELSLIALPLIAFVLLILGGGIALVLVLVLRQPQRRTLDPNDALSPLDRAQAAAAALNEPEWQEFLRWAAGQRRPPPDAGEGIRK
jgi:hypothetical protein